MKDERTVQMDKEGTMTSASTTTVAGCIACCWEWQLQSATAFENIPVTSTHFAVMSKTEASSAFPLSLVSKAPGKQNEALHFPQQSFLPLQRVTRCSGGMQRGSDELGRDQP